MNALHLLWNNSAWLLKPLTLSAIGNDDWILQNKFFVVCKCPGGRDTINCQMPGPRDSSCIKCPGFTWGMLVAGIDTHILFDKANKIIILE